jgi:hypothetical protein
LVESNEKNNAEEKHNPIRVECPILIIPQNIIMAAKNLYIKDSVVWFVFADK